MVVSVIVAAVAPLLAKGAEALAKNAGEKVAGKVVELCHTIENKFKGDSYAEQTLARAREKPEIEGRQAALKEVLTEKMEADPDFAQKVTKLVEEVQKEQASSRKVFNQQGQTVHGPQTNIGGNVQGNVFSGILSGPVAMGGDAVDLRDSKGAINKPSGSVTQHYGNQISIPGSISGDGVIIGNHNQSTVIKQTASKGNKTSSKPITGTDRIDFLLVTPLSEERDAVLKKLENHRKQPPLANDKHTYFRAQVTATFPDSNSGLYQVILLPLVGMGLLEAATATTTAIEQWNPKYVVLIGIAGGIAARGVQIGDILIADQIADYELQKVTPDGPEIRWDVHQVDPRLLGASINFIDESWKKLLQVERPGPGEPKLFKGPIASGDKVIAFGDFLKKPQEAWPKLIGVEMEAAGAAKAAFQSSADSAFFMVRCASDLADENKGSTDVKKWRNYACDVAASFAIGLLRSGPVPID
jgi:nucleoside phosphorylase